MAEELNNSLDHAGHALPMPLFASEQAQPAEIEMGSVIERKEPEPAPVIETPKPEPTPVVEAPEPEAASVPLPTDSVLLPSDSVPLPSTDSVPLPTQEEPVEEAGFKNEVEVDYAAQDAFAGAFGSQLVPEPEVVPEPVEEVPSEPEPVEAPPEEVVSEPEPVVEQEPEEEWVSDAERFIAADVDDSGSLSVEELAVAANVTIREAEELQVQPIRMVTEKSRSQNLFPLKRHKRCLPCLVRLLRSASRFSPNNNLNSSPNNQYGNNQLLLVLPLLRWAGNSLYHSNRCNSRCSNQ